MIHIDFETFSSVDLKSAGMHRYMESPDFEILLMAYAEDDHPAICIDLTESPSERRQALALLRSFEGCLKVAHNAPFEMNAISKQGITVCVRDWRCSAVLATYLSLPRSLGELSDVMKLAPDKAKDKRGKQLIQMFCKPRKPTKNDPRTRYTRETHPVEWAQFMEYCRMDVEAEREVWNRLQPVRMPDFEWERWFFDQEVNQRGMLVDMPFVEAAIEVDREYRGRLMEEARELTGLMNPNSGKQLLAWLKEEMPEDEVESLKKTEVKRLLGAADDTTVERVLRIRQELAKTSVKKYAALRKGVCADSRLRGSLLFYGASRTHRWSGKMFQPHNLPQNHMDDLEGAREVVRTGDLDMVDFLYGSVSNVLSELIRTSIVAPPGKKFIIADFSAIEARMLAWLANEEWVLEVFRGHGKIYEATASQMFNVPIESVTKGSEMRRNGKVAVLACIAEGSLVLTERGLVPIEKVDNCVRVWDGVEWVHHGGVVCRGEREVVTYDGLTATPDHLVWVAGQGRCTRLAEAISLGSRLEKTGDRGSPVRVGEDYIITDEISSRLETSDRADIMHRVWGNQVDAVGEPEARKNSRVPTLLSTETDTPGVRSGSHQCEAEMHKSARRGSPQIRGSGHTVQFRERAGGGSVGDGEPRPSPRGRGTGQDRQQRPLRAGESEMGHKGPEHGESRVHPDTGVDAAGLAIRSIGCIAKTEGRPIPGGDTRRCTDGDRPEEEELERHTAVVYDILNCGPRNRFTVSDVLVHNCGYGGGVGALAAMDTKKEIPEDMYEPLKKMWRAANPNIVKWWWQVDEAATEAVKNPGLRYKAGKVSFIREKGFLFCDMPDGNRLCYPRPRIKWDEKFEKDSIVYEGVDQNHPKWGEIRTYGCKLVENCTQSLARSALVEGMLAVDRAGFPIVLHIHDEAVVEADPDVEVEVIEKLLAYQPAWAPDLPLRADGFESLIYRKDG